MNNHVTGDCTKDARESLHDKFEANALCIVSKCLSAHITYSIVTLLTVPLHISLEKYECIAAVGAAAAFVPPTVFVRTGKIRFR